MPEVLDWRRVERPATAARSVAAALRQGAVVAFPTESAYIVAASGQLPDAVERMQDVVGARPLEVALPAPGAARDWLPSLTGAGLRLANRLWPGPLTLASSDGVGGGLAGRLPSEVREALTPDSMLHLRHAAHEAIQETTRRFAGPILCASVPAGTSEAYTARHVLDLAGTKVDLVIDAPARFRQPPTVVEVRGGAWQVRREGVLSSADLGAQLVCVVVFVCTGNTCRSPMAEVLCKKRLAEKLGCSVSELTDRGYQVLSAGLAAGQGFPAADEAVAVARSMGADLAAHQSRPLTLELAARADHLLVMTRGHAQALQGQLPAGSARPGLLSPDGDDVADPIGGPREVYEACARQMDGYIERLVASLGG